VDIEFIRERIREGNYLFKSHAVRHALKEGFDRRHVVEAVLCGSAIEE
jgi:Arc/MetJ-type ribon-helix-helix transcriptional regulator